MKLYEINEEIRELLMLLEPDPETGEVPANEDELAQRLHQLKMERTSVLEYLAKAVLNIRGSVTALKAEEERLNKRRNSLEQREERILRVLDRECNGETTDLGVATVRYRATVRTEVTDATKAIEWLNAHNHTDCIRIKAPEVDKSAVKALMKMGEMIPGVLMRHERSCSLR